MYTRQHQDCTTITLKPQPNILSSAYLNSFYCSKWNRRDELQAYGTLGFIGPGGSKDPNNRVLGPKYYTINGIWALKHYYLGPWTLRGM